MEQIKKIVEKINHDNIFKIVDHVFDLLEDIDIIFWLGSGFVNYIWNNNYYTWTNFCKKEYSYLKIQDFFTLTQIDFDYPNQINEINNQIKKEDFKQNGFKKLVKQIHQILYYKNGNDSQIYGKSRISFITTNHCRSVEEYFDINNTYYLKDILYGNNNDPISNLNCFYLHSYSDNYHEWIYKIEHYKKFLDSDELKKIFIFFKNKFNKQKIIFCFGNSLNEVHLVSTLSEMNSNEKSLIVNIRTIEFEEYKNKEKIRKYYTNLTENLSKFNEYMINLPNSKVINLYLTNYDDAENIWNILRNQFAKRVKKLPNFKIHPFYGGINESSIIKNELNNYKNSLTSKKKVYTILNNFLKENNNKILEEIWDNFSYDSITISWFFLNINKIKFLKNIDIYKIISLWWWCIFGPKDNYEIFNFISSFVSKNRIKELDIYKREMQISTLIEHLSLVDNLPEHLIELIANYIIKILWNSWNFGCATIFFKEKYLNILSNTLKNNKHYVAKCVYLKLKELNLDNKSIGKTLFIFESLSRFNLITMQDILKILNINLKSMMLEIYYKDIMWYISKYFSDNQDKFENELTQSSNNDQYKEKLYLAMKYNILLKNQNIDIFNEFDKKYKDLELIDNNKIYSRTAGSNLKPNDDDKDMIDNWKDYDNLNILLKRLIVRYQESWEKEDALVYLFRKFKLDNNKCDWDTINNFFNIIQFNDEYLKCLNNYSTFFSIIINEAYHNLIKEYQLEIINAIDFKSILECLNKFEKYKTENYSLNLFEFQYKDLDQLIYFIEIAYEVNCYILIKSILSDFSCVGGYPTIFTIFTNISKRKFTLFHIFKRLHEKNLLLDILNNIWPNNIHNHDINNICSDVADNKLFLFKMIYTQKKWDKAEMKKNFSNDYIALTAEYFYKLNIMEEQYFHYINLAYHNFLNFVLWIYNKDEMSKLVFIDSNIDFLRKHNNMYELFIQLILFSEQDNMFDHNKKEFIDKWRELVIRSFFLEIERISYFIGKKIFNIANLLNSNISSKIEDTIFTKISDKLNNETHTMKDFYKQNKNIDNLLLLGVLSFNKIQNKIPISNTYLYRFLNKNKSDLKLNKESIDILKKKLWDYKSKAV